MNIEGEKSGEITPEATERGVVVDDKYLGRELGMFKLSSLTEPMLGSDKFDEVYIDTSSGNSYLIRKNPAWKDYLGFYDHPAAKSRIPSHDFEIVNARTNQGKEEKDWKTTPLSEEDIGKGILQVGNPFEYGKGGRTTRVRSITCLQVEKRYMPDYLQMVRKEGTSNVRSKFRKQILGK